MKKIICLIVLLFTGSANAGIISVGPFSGSLNDSFETRSGFQPSLFSIMDGGASVTSTASIFAYQPGVTNFGIGIPAVTAQVHDGVKALGVNGGAATTTISFTDTVSAFGGYWGTGSPSNGFNIDFFDSTSALIDSLLIPYTNNGAFGGDGALDWHGWTSTTGISSVAIRGDFVVFDALTASVVPEPSILALFGMGLFGIGYVRRKNA